MPVHRHKKDTTTPLSGSTPEQTAPTLPDQQTFRQYLRELARSAIRVVLEDVMREELDALIGVGWGECSPKRKGYRNGFYTRDLVTSSGRIQDINVPRDRAGQFHTQVFERYSRYEPHIARSDSRRCLWQGQARDIRRGSGPNLDGRRPQREHDQSSQPDAHPAI